LSGWMGKALRSVVNLKLKAACLGNAYLREHKRSDR
jgi:hypothetical protein